MSLSASSALFFALGHVDVNDDILQDIDTAPVTRMPALPLVVLLPAGPVVTMKWLSNACTTLGARRLRTV